MQVIPVLDLRHGQAVHAIAGNRAQYGPLASILHVGTDPVALARAGRDTWNLRNLYLADLDAILGENPADVELYRKLAELGLTLWIDAGVREASDVSPLVEAGVERVIVGLETVRGPQALAEILAEFGPNRVVFSLDERDGTPIVGPSADWGTDRRIAIAEQVVNLGIRRIIHLDLSKVGTGQNSRIGGMCQSYQWLADLALANDPLEWLVGGGISTKEDLRTLARVGAWGALVGSALHDGSLRAWDLKGLKAS